ncbi:MAG: glycosyltransferase, partial [Bdellovibrionales bacterium]
MNIVIFGLTISSTWGHGHATLWRALCRSLVKRGHRITFFERDESYYRDHRNLTALPGMDIVFYPDWASIRNRAAQSAQHADLAIVTSYCPDGTDASDLVLNSSAALKVFYDLDTPVTLSLLARGQAVPYLPAGGLAGFDLVLSYSGGETLKRVRRDLGARRVVALYGSVDPESHFPVPICPHYRADLSYIGTYAQDRQDRLEKLFLAPAARLKSRRFTLAGSLYPPDFPWAENIFYFQHLPPAEHAAFYGSSRLTLNITREAMAHNGYCPSGRLFEAAACGAPILSDYWEGLDLFFEPGREILV